MDFSVKDALLNEGERYDFAIELPMEPLDYMGRIDFAAPAVVNGQYYAENGQILACGTVEVDLLLECDRCLKQFTKRLTVEIYGTFSHESDNVEFYPISRNDTIDFRPLISDVIISGIPIERLCKEDCKGICPYCGMNKNFSECSCTPPEDDNPFSVLRKLMD